jgi:uncharacterized protein (DUF1778 family)
LVRLDEESKALLEQAAQMRELSVSDYVRSVVVAHAKKEVQAPEQHFLALTPEEQLAFWTALSKPVRLSAAQRRLGRLMQDRTLP